MGRVDFVCEICVGDVPNLSKRMVCGAVAKSLICVSISERNWTH